MVKFVKIDTFQKVKDFVNLMQDITEETVLHSEKYSVDAKSIMGVFSLDLSKPITLEIELSPTTTVSDIQRISEKILQFGYTD